MMKTASLHFFILLNCIFLFHANSAVPSGSATLKSSGYAPVNGMKIYYEIHGEGQPLVLLHGAYMTIGNNWSALIPEFSRTRQVIALELQGHGHTEMGNRPLSYEALADDVAKVLNYLKIDSADVLGYSFGGTVAYKLVMDHPSLVRKLVIVSSTHRYDGWQKEVRDMLQTMKPEFLSSTPLKADYLMVAPDTGRWNNFVNAMIEFDKKDFNLGDENIKKIKCPVLLMIGDNDGIDKEMIIKTYKDLGGCTFGDIAGIPPSHLAIVPGQSHVSLIMQTDIISKRVNAFLK